MIRTFFISTSILALAACGGSGGGGSAGGGSSFDDVLNDFETNPVLTAGLNDSVEYAQFSTLSAAGGASYEGDAIVYSEIGTLNIDEVDDISDLPTPTLAGSVALQTSFSGDEGTLTGSFGDFVDSNGNSKTGTITLSEGEVTEDFEGDAFMAASIDGTLSGSGAGNGRYQGLVFGSFTTEGVVGVGVGLPITSTTDIDDLTEDDIEELEDFAESDAFAIIFAAD
ncbi:hypothetical protein MWU61_10695 [Loktanella sp. F6476L]|uniref:hypothetical protein n=1 Tax=Loktanella sp. F6476L TaxID=2926405 RepID=UPI001FF69E88|nr:hypothetical protein [Loktanella sp. F6476L]MCK0121011.1 hypothetical protein [Loktanella sp. F6476L]